MTMLKLMKIRVGDFYDNYVYTLLVPESMDEDELLQKVEEAHRNKSIEMSRIP